MSVESFIYVKMAEHWINSCNLLRGIQESLCLHGFSVRLRD